MVSRIKTQPSAERMLHGVTCSKSSQRQATASYVVGITPWYFLGICVLLPCFPCQRSSIHCLRHRPYFRRTSEVDQPACSLISLRRQAWIKNIQMHRFLIEHQHEMNLSLIWFSVGYMQLTHTRTRTGRQAHTAHYLLLVKLKTLQPQANAPLLLIQATLSAYTHESKTNV